MLGPPVDENFPDIEGYVTRDDFLYETTPPADFNATYAAALAVGVTRGVARGAHLEAISIMGNASRYGMANITYVGASEMEAAIDRILSACGDDKVICIVAFPQPYRETKGQDVANLMQKARGSRRKSSSKGVIVVAPATDQNRRHTSQTSASITVDVWVPAFPILEEGTAAVMRAAGVTASFVSRYWNEKHKKPEPAFIKRQILDAKLFTSNGLPMIHIPNTVSGKLDPPIPNQLPSTGNGGGRKRFINDQQSEERRVKRVQGTHQRSEERNLHPAFRHTIDSNLLHGAALASPPGHPEDTNSPSTMATGVDDRITTSYGMYLSPQLPHEDHTPVNSHWSPGGPEPPFPIDPALLPPTDPNIFQYPPLTTTGGHHRSAHSSLDVATGMEDRITTSSGMHSSTHNAHKDHRRVNSQSSP
ncbi:hypothetical protein H0H93_016481 [Arthromyces matolae]|nr:hypothetical protein H0H93_016481 [Arthromyces matolae]